MEYLREAPPSAQSLDAPPLSVVGRHEGTTLALHVRGEADLDAADRLRAELVSALHPNIRSADVDLSELAFCDLHGSDALHAFVDEARSLGISVDLHGMSPLLAYIYAEFPPRCHPAAKQDGLTLR